MQFLLFVNRWRDLIGNCAKIMKRLPLVINRELPSDLGELEISRKIQKIMMNEINNEHPDGINPRDFLAVFEMHGSVVRELVLRRMKFTADVFCDMLRLLPKLKKIALEHIDFNYFDEIRQNVLTPDLTHVVLSECHPNVRCLLVCSILNDSKLIPFPRFCTSSTLRKLSA